MKNNFKIITSENHKKMPWKNGKGVTSEILIWPEGAELSKNNFEWRLSSAPLLEPGEFSLFLNYQRMLTLLDEGCVNLLDSSNSQTILKFGQLFGFSGSEKIRYELPSGPVKDLGFIYQKSLTPHFEIRDINEEFILPQFKNHLLIYVLLGEIEILNSNTRLSQGSVLHVQTGKTHEDIQIHSTSEPAKILWIIF